MWPSPGETEKLTEGSTIKNNKRNRQIPRIRKKEMRNRKRKLGRSNKQELTNQLINSEEHSPSREANRSSVSQKFLII
jgi:hypothetical protein